jgi:hypothetical protein
VEPQVLFVFALVALAALGAYLSWKAEQQRRADLERVAASLDLRYDPSDDDSHDDEYAQFDVFRRGHSRTARNTMRGTVELFGSRCRLCMGDFRYKVTSGSGKHRSTKTYRFSYLIVHPPWPAPSLLVRPEGLFDKLKGAIGFDDIDFESEEFSRKFYVQSSDKRFAYDVLHPRMMEFLLREQPDAMDLEGGAMCVTDGSRLWEPADFRARLDFVRRFCELWPRHLLVDLAK